MIVLTSCNSNSQTGLTDNASQSTVTSDSNLTATPGTTQTNFPLTMDKMPSESESNGTFCQSILGQGWYCTVEIRVVNTSSAPWNGTMTANLITPQGVISEGSISSEVNYLTSTFDSKVNPGQGYRWSTYFEVGPNMRFQFVQILNNGQTVAAIPVCIGSSDKDAMGC